MFITRMVVRPHPVAPTTVTSTVLFRNDVLNLQPGQRRPLLRELTVFALVAVAEDAKSSVKSLRVLRSYGAHRSSKDARNRLGDARCVIVACPASSGSDSAPSRL